MAQEISDIWAGLRAAGLPEVMLYLPDNSASRCHWDDTAEIGGVRVALLADQDRKIVRILPVDSCVGIGVASPKGTDPSGYKAIVQGRLMGKGQPDTEAEDISPEPEPVPVVATAPVDVPEPEPPTAVETPEPPASRFGLAPRPTPRPAGAAGSR